MLRELLKPRYLPATLLVLALAALFVRLGFWQLDRLAQVRGENQVGESRLSQPVTALTGLLGRVEGDPESVVYRRVWAEGVFSTGDEVLIRSQVHLGVAGFHVVTPLVLDDGSAILVDRGWVPLALDTVPVTQASPPAGERRVEGWLEPSRSRPTFGPTDPAEGRLQVLSRVDIDRIQAQTDLELAAVYLVMTGGADEDLPAPVDPPTFGDDGPHLGYAIQWFGFAIIGLVGYPALLRRRRAQASAGKASPSTTS